MPNILHQIVENKKKEIEELKKIISIKSLQEKLPQTTSSFLKSLTQNGKVGIIAEIKLKSPSEGEIVSYNSLVIARLVKEYEELGVQAISLVTDRRFFGGEESFIEEATSLTSFPILQKDFVIDPVQIYQSKVNGAQALLLIARILSEEKLIQYVNLCRELELEPVVEVYDDADLTKALATKTNCIGVNARNLTNFAVNIDDACNVGRKIPKDKVFIGFSGVKTRDDIKKYADSGAAAVLIGTNLLKAENKKEFIQNLTL